ncbi:hypothetical protein [Mesorhizobium sp.]|uniref:hypothetical protein n=1 Tax=Mesorhizobium sp. TaxID=1871066 RepID=UPI0025D4DD5B|nr:hypothetical protein [Mesorhizobium sp.]
MMLLDRPDTTDSAKHDGAYRGRRLSWQEFYKLTGREPAANDNERPAEKAA